MFMEWEVRSEDVPEAIKQITGDSTTLYSWGKGDEQFDGVLWSEAVNPGLSVRTMDRGKSYIIRVETRDDLSEGNWMSPMFLEDMSKFGCSAPGEASQWSMDLWPNDGAMLGH